MNPTGILRPPQHLSRFFAGLGGASRENLVYTVRICGEFGATGAGFGPELLRRIG